MLNLLELDYFLKNQKNFPRNFKQPVNFIKMQNTLKEKKQFYQTNDDRFQIFKNFEIDDQQLYQSLKYLQNDKQNFALQPSFPKIQKKFDRSPQPTPLIQFKKQDLSTRKLKKVNNLKIKNLIAEQKCRETQYENINSNINIRHYLKIIEKSKNI